MYVVCKALNSAIATVIKHGEGFTNLITNMIQGIGTGNVLLGYLKDVI